MFTLPSAPFLTSATESGSATPFYALAGSGGGSNNLPPGSNGAYLYYNGSAWVTQVNPVTIGSNSTVPVSCVSIGQNNSMGSATNCFIVGNGNSLAFNPDSCVAVGDTLTVGANNSVVIGTSASVAGLAGVAIGAGASVGLATNSISIGANAGNVNHSKTNNISIGNNAGNGGPLTNQGSNAINIGTNAGAALGGSFDNSITLNASGGALSAEFSSLYVSPVLASTMTNYLSYDPASKLVGYGVPPQAPPTFSLITLGPTSINSLAYTTPNEFAVASSNIASLLPSGHSYLITIKVSYDLTQNPADAGFTTALTSNSFVNPLIGWGSGASPGTIATIGLYSTNYVGSNDYFGQDAGGSFPNAWDTTLSGIIDIPFNATMAVYFLLQFTKATYTAPPSGPAINQFNFTAIQLT